MNTYDERIARLEQHMRRAHELGRLPHYYGVFAEFGRQLSAGMDEFARRMALLGKQMAPLIREGMRVQAEQDRMRRRAGL